MAKKRAKRAGGRPRRARTRKAGRAGARAPKAGAKATRPRKAAAARHRRGGAARAKTRAHASRASRSTTRRTTPIATRRSTEPGEAARRSPRLERERRRLPDIDEPTPGPPSSLDLDRTASAARTGRHVLLEKRRDHTETSPALTGGDVDADWEDAYSVGDEAPGGDNPTPDQDRVDDIGKALGVEYQDNEELRPIDKIADRDKRRWELDPASSEDYRDRKK